MKKVYCIGEALIDFVAERQGSNLSEAGNFTRKAGGAPANVACAISKLGGRSAFVGCVGEDPFGTYLLRVFGDIGVDVTLCQRSDTFTTLAFVSLADDGERDFVFSRGADRELEYNPTIKARFPGNIVHLGAATALLGGKLEEAYAHYFFDALTEDAFISFDPNFRQDLWKKREKDFIKKCRPFLQRAHLCKFSLEEIRLLSGKEDLGEATSALHKDGAGIITVTLGADGTFLSTGHETCTVPSIRVRAVDTTGAGDAFVGCLLQQMAGMDQLEGLAANTTALQDMVALANKAGAITTTNYGAIGSLPDMEQLVDS